MLSPCVAAFVTGIVVRAAATRDLKRTQPGEKVKRARDSTRAPAGRASAVGGDHLVGYPDDAAHAFGEGDEGGSLLGGADESPQMDDPAGHDDVARTKVGPVLIGQARQQLVPDLAIRLLRRPACREEAKA